MDKKISESCDKLHKLNQELKICSNNQSNMKNDSEKKDSIVAKFLQTKREIEHFLNKEQNILCAKRLVNRMNFDQIVDNIKNEINFNKIQLKKNIETVETAELKSDQSGSTNSIEINKIGWRFDYFYDYLNKGSKIHGLKNNGTILECNCKHQAWKLNKYDKCRCFYCAYSLGMTPNSGLYTIKIKINKIECKSSSNVIGIISQDSKDSINTMGGINNKNILSGCWSHELHDYIGWSTSDTVDKISLPNGLRCGTGPTGGNSRMHNIFRRNNFQYKSNNQYYRERLPSIETGDVIVLSYNSNLNKLSFGKDNDNGKLDSYIDNLPKMKTFYWFVGHVQGAMSLHVLN